MRYQAVIFDLFGTLIETISPPDYDAMLSVLARSLGADDAAFRGAWRSSTVPRESGRLGEVRGILTSTAHAVGARPSTQEIARAGGVWLAHARAWLVPRPDAVPTLEGIRSAGARVGLVSNCSAEAPAVWRETAFAPLVDHAVFSCEAGAMKPDATVYHAACRALGVEPARCLFVGDGGARELTGARAVGMDAALIRAPGEEHVWFDENYRRDALEWTGPTIASLEELASLLG